MNNPLIENPLLSVLTGITGLLAGVNTFIGSLGVPPFWADTFLALILSYMLVHWVRQIILSWKKQQRQSRLQRAEEHKESSVKSLFKTAGISIVILPLLLSL